ncbi:MAG: sigma-70 family RNA polymerase sigma factor [Corallococcus sp.]|nr:sigma-70 family RNA polymerase sigma factor [Corallococcus sp.]
MTELIQKAKNGDSEALACIVAEYKGLVRSVANKFYLVGGNKDDLLQEGMIGLFNAVTDYDQSKGAFPSFVKLCVLRQVIRAVKTDSANKNKPLSNYVELSSLYGVAENGINPLEILIDKELSERMKQIIASSLTSTEKKTLQLFLQGYGYDEICKSLGKSYKSVDGALQRARKKLLAVKE